MVHALQTNREVPQKIDNIETGFWFTICGTMNQPTQIDVNSLPVSNPGSISSTYCNNANLAVTPWDIRLIFNEVIVGIQPGDASSVLKASLVMNPAHAKALIGALSAAIAQYEQLYGQIKMPEVPHIAPCAEKA